MIPAAHVTGLGTALPPHRIAQDDARRAARALFADLSDARWERLAAVFDSVHIDGRNTCMPAAWFAEEHSFAERNDLYQRWAVELGTAAAERALSRAGVRGDELGGIVFVSTTGLATPSLDARLLTTLGMPRRARREAVFGRGCAGGAVGLGLAAERAALDPAAPVLLVVVELCSLTFRRADASTANVVATALFADGAAAAVLSADPDAAGPSVVGRDGATWPDTEDVMGWQFGDDGMAVMLARSIPALVARELRPSVDAACARLGLDADAIDHHLVHPGSPIVLDAAADALGLDRRALDRSHRSLCEHGNMSAASILFILERFLADGSAQPGDLAMLTALGPGFSAEHVVLGW